MAMRDQWQKQRRQRQQEVAQRQQEVYATLALNRQERQNKASQLRSDLSLFIAGLERDNQTRRSRSQQFQQDLQQFYLNLQQQTQNFLASSAEQRRIQTEKLTQELEQFVQTLQSQTAQFLSVTAADRAMMAQQLARDLQVFETNLKATVVVLRQQMQLLHQQIQASVVDLKVATQQQLAAMHQQRLQAQVQLAQKLTMFVESLRSEVQDYCTELELMRQQRSQILWAELAQSRAERVVELQAMFGRLAEFRAELRDFHTTLRKTVGIAAGDATVQSEIAIPTVVKAIAAEQPVQATVVEVPKAVPVAAVVMTSPKTKVAPPAPMISTIEVAAKATKAPAKAPTTHEKEVYNYIHQVEGARLVQIESALGINRFQAVDALRSLIKKGLVTQRDRVYYIQESFTLS